jgi:hypothetical protein
VIQWSRGNPEVIPDYLVVPFSDPASYSYIGVLGITGPLNEDRCEGDPGERGARETRTPAAQRLLSTPKLMRAAFLGILNPFLAPLTGPDTTATQRREVA